MAAPARAWVSVRPPDSAAPVAGRQYRPQVASVAVAVAVAVAPRVESINSGTVSSGSTATSGAGGTSGEPTRRQASAVQGSTSGGALKRAGRWRRRAAGGSAYGGAVGGNGGNNSGTGGAGGAGGVEAIGTQQFRTRHRKGGAGGNGSDGGTGGAGRGITNANERQQPTVRNYQQCRWVGDRGRQRRWRRRRLPGCKPVTAAASPGGVSSGSATGDAHTGGTASDGGPAVTAATRWCCRRERRPRMATPRAVLVDHQVPQGFRRRRQFGQHRGPDGCEYLRRDRHRRRRRNSPATAARAVPAA